MYISEVTREKEGLTEMLGHQVFHLQKMRKCLQVRLFHGGVRF